MNVKKQLRVLKEAWEGCERCDLSTMRGPSPVIFGAGASRPTYLFVYDVPSEDDLLNGAPMSGEHGELLAGFLTTNGFDIAQTYCTPVVSCRPMVIVPATDDLPERLATRPPTKTEAFACMQRLHALIYLLDPQLIFVMGELAWKALVRPKDRGGVTTFEKAAQYEIFQTRVPGKHVELQYPVIATLSMQHAVQSPSHATTGSFTVITKSLLRGQRYVKKLQAFNEKDARKFPTAGDTSAS